MGRVEQQRMRKALIDAEMELQQGAVAAQDKRKALQVAFTYPHMVFGLEACHDQRKTHVLA